MKNKLHTLVGFLSVSCTQKLLKEEGAKNKEKSVYRFTSLMTVPLESDILATACSERRERQMRVLHEAIKI